MTGRLELLGAAERIDGVHRFHEGVAIVEGDLHLEPLDVDDATLAVEAIAEVGHGGHFFASPHTMERYESAFYTPLVSDWRNFESWTEAGSVDATERAHRIWRRLLADYEQPPLDPAVDEALTDFVERRKRQLTP